MFIARISRGARSGRFVGAVLIIPTVIGSLWFTGFRRLGDPASARDQGDMLIDGSVDTNTALFHLLDGLPLRLISSLLAVLVIVLFFITSRTQARW